MRHLISTLATLATGAAAMYYMDPDMGRRRRALMRDKLDAASHDASEYALARSKRAAGQMKGLVAQAREQLGLSTPPTSNEQLRERIRARLGRLVSHPGAIDVEVEDGSVCLTGHILEREVDTLLSTVSAMPGVEHVDNQLAAHEEPGNIPQLQGENRRGGRAAEHGKLPMLLLTAPIMLVLLAATHTADSDR